jgi:ankyrin repeat protein/uncharacterized caspase-like protein
VFKFNKSFPSLPLLIILTLFSLSFVSSQTIANEASIPAKAIINALKDDNVKQLESALKGVRFSDIYLELDSDQSKSGTRDNQKNIASKEPLLHAAVILRAKRCVKWLIKQVAIKSSNTLTSIDIAQLDRQDYTALSHSLFTQQFSIAKSLIKVGANINQTVSPSKQKQLNTAFAFDYGVLPSLVLANADIKSIDWLIKNGGLLSSQSGNKNLYGVALASGHEALVDRMLSLDPVPFEQAYIGGSVNNVPIVMIGCFSKISDFFKRALNKQLDPNLYHNQISLLNMCITKNNLVSVQSLVDNGAQINSADISKAAGTDSDIYQYLKTKVDTKKQQMIDFLKAIKATDREKVLAGLSIGLDLNQDFSAAKSSCAECFQPYQLGTHFPEINYSVQSPFLLAIFTSDIKWVNELINLGAKVNQTTQSGITPIALALAEKKLNMVNELIKQGAKLSDHQVAELVKQGQFKLATRHIQTQPEWVQFWLENDAAYVSDVIKSAIESKQLEFLNTLVSAGFSFDQTNSYFYPVNLALQTRDANVVQLVANHSKDLSRYQYENPVELALSNGSIDLVRYLSAVGFTFSRYPDAAIKPKILAYLLTSPTQETNKLCANEDFDVYYSLEDLINLENLPTLILKCGRPLKNNRQSANWFASYLDKQDFGNAKLLIKYGLSVNYRISDLYRNHLEAAVVDGKLSTIKFLLENGFQHSFAESNNRSPALIAVENNRPTIALFLLNQLKLTEADKQSEAARLLLIASIQNSSPQVLAWLVDQGISFPSDIESTCNQSDQTIALCFEQKIANISIEQLNQKLADAVYYQNEAATKELLSAGADPNLSGIDPIKTDETLLMNAAKNGNEKILALLIEHGADPNTTIDSESAITRVFRSKNQAAITILLEQSKQLLNDPRVIERLYNDLNYDENGPAILRLIRENYAPAKTLLAKVSAWLNFDSFKRLQESQDISYWGLDEINNAITTAVAPGFDFKLSHDNDADRIKILNLLVSLGGDPSAPISERLSRKQADRENNLSHSLQRGSIATVGWLLEQGLKIPSEFEDYAPALKVLADNRQLNLIEKLLKLGANPNLALSNDDRLLNIALLNNDIKLVRLALKYQSATEVTSRNHSNFTPLMIAIEQQKPELVRLLLEFGANANSRAADPLGLSPLMLAVEKDNIELVSLLLDKGANPKAIDRQGRSVIQRLATNNPSPLSQRLNRALVEQQNTQPSVQLSIAKGTIHSKIEDLRLDPKTNRTLSLRRQTDHLNNIDYIELWDEDNQRAVRTLYQSSGILVDLLFARFINAQQALISYRNEKSIVTVDLFSGETVAVFDASGNKILDRYSQAIASSALSRDGTILAIAANSEIKLIRLNDRKLIKRWQAIDGEALEFVDNDKTINVIGKDQNYVKLSVDTSERLEFDRFYDHSIKEPSFIVQASANRFLLASGQESTFNSNRDKVWLWNQSSDTIERVYNLGFNRLKSIQLSPSKTHFVGLTNKNLIYWDIEKKQPEWNIKVSSVSDSYSIDKVEFIDEKTIAIYNEGEASFDIIDLVSSENKKKVTFEAIQSFHSLISIGDDSLIALDRQSKSINRLNWKTEKQRLLYSDSQGEISRLIRNGEKGFLAFSNTGEVIGFDLSNKQPLWRHPLLSDETLRKNCYPNLGRGASAIRENEIIFKCTSKELFDSRAGLYSWSLNRLTEAKISYEWSNENSNGYTFDPVTDQLYVVGGNIRSSSYLKQVDLNSDSYATRHFFNRSDQANQSINSLALTDKLLLSGSENMNELLKWQLSKAPLASHTFEKLLYQNNSQPVNGISISDDETRSINWQTNWAEVWNLESNQLQAAIQIVGSIMAAKFSADGKSIYLSGDDNTLYQFDSSNGEKLYQSPVLTAMIRSIDVSNDGGRYLTAARNVQVWDSSNHQLIKEYPVAIGEARKAYFDASGQLILAGIVSPLDEKGNSLARVDVINITSSRIQSSHPEMTLLTQSKDRRLFVTQSSDNKVHIWQEKHNTPYKTISHTQKIGWNADAAINRNALFLSGKNYLIQHSLVDGKTSLVRGSGIPFERAMSYSEDRRWALKLESEKRSIWYSVDDNRQLGCIDDNLTRFESIDMAVENQSLILSSKLGKYLVQAGGSTCSGPLLDNPAPSIDVASNEPVTLWQAKQKEQDYQAGMASMVTIAPNHSRVAFVEDNHLRVLSLQTGELVGPFSAHSQMVGLRFSDSGQRLIVLLRDGSFELFDSDSGIPLLSAKTQFSSHQNLEFVNQDSQVRIESYYITQSRQDCDPFCSDTVEKIRVSTETWDISNGNRIAQTTKESAPKQTTKDLTRSDIKSNPIEIKTDSVYQKIWWGQENGVLSDDGNLVAQFNKDKITIWNKQQRPFDIAQKVSYQPPRLMAFINKNQHFLTVDKDGLFTFYNTPDGKKLAEIHIAQDSTWLALDQQGRYDSNRPGDIPFAAWVSDDSPVEALPIEVFMNDFFKPRLIPSILSGEKYSKTNNVATLNRIRPEVSIESIKLQPNGEKIDVTVSITETAKQQQVNGQLVSSRSGFKGIRLFRNGHQVGYSSESAGISIANKGKLNERPLASKRITFTDIQLPNILPTPLDKSSISLQDAKIELSAYAFNIDNIKSATVRKNFKLPNKKQQRKPKAYVVTIGVNQFKNSSWDLTYAVPDANAIHKTVVENLSNTNNYRQVIGINLSTDDGKMVPNKALITEVFSRLSGASSVQEKTTTKSTSINFSDWPELNELDRVHPDDTLLVSYSGHGYASADGDFHLFPQDIAAGTKREVTPELLSSTITSADLNQMLRGIDSENFMVIIDACNSAASVEGKDFRPGPMGSSGLGQIAYNKQMMILTASQAEEFALESDQLNHGLLTYSLIEEGLKSQSADQLPRDNSISAKEWLSYGLKRVPSLYQSLVNNNLALNNSRGIRVKPVVKTAQPEVKEKAESVQQPGLFDYSKKAPLVISDY